MRDLRILPVGYGVAGFISATSRGGEDDDAERERALLSAAAHELSAIRIRKADKARRQLSEALEDQLQALESERRNLESVRQALLSGHFGDRPDLEQELADIAALRRMNLALNTTVEIQGRQLDELRGTRH